MKQRVKLPALFAMTLEACSKTGLKNRTSTTTLFNNHRFAVGRTEKLLKKGVMVGPLLPKPEVKPWNGGYILVTGGTLGYKQLFDVISQSTLKNVVLQTGKVDPEPYKKRHPEWEIIDYSTVL